VLDGCNPTNNDMRRSAFAIVRISPFAPFFFSAANTDNSADVGRRYSSATASKGVVDWSPGAFAAARRFREITFLSFLVCLAMVAVILAAIVDERWSVVAAGIDITGNATGGAFGPRTSCDVCSDEDKVKFTVTLAFAILALIGTLAMAAGTLGSVLQGMRSLQHLRSYESMLHIIGGGGTFVSGIVAVAVWASIFDSVDTCFYHAEGVYFMSLAAVVGLLFALLAIPPTGDIMRGIVEHVRYASEIV
jgi:hypothetical protein